MFFCLFGLCLFVLACGGSGGSGGSGVVTSSGSGGILYGRITVPPDLRLNLAQVSGTSVPRALVWLENFPENTTLTDENGNFTLNNVPFSSAQRVVGRYDVAVSGEIYLVRTEPFVLEPGNPIKQLNDLQLSKGLYSFTGILRNPLGQIVENARLRIWGIEFSTDSNGQFISPPLPESAGNEKLTVTAAGYRTYEIELPIIHSLDNQIRLELTLSETGEPNFAPVPYFEQVPAQVAPGERILLSLKVIDPDELLNNQFKPEWNATTGKFDSVADILNIYWTAPDTSGPATISAKVVDSRGAEGRVELGIAVGGIKTPVVRVDSVTPSGAIIGNQVVITGSGFGADKTRIQVSFNGTLATIESCKENEIVTRVPAGAVTGILLITTPAGEKSAGIFSILDSGLAISPDYGPPGTIVTLSGKNFGDSSVGNIVQVNGKDAIINSWNDQSIVFSVPDGATAGVVSLKIGEKTRFAGIFRVTRIFSVSTTKSRMGDELTIEGEGWGTEYGSSFLEFSGSARAQITSWSDSRLTFKVPAGAVSGPLNATVQNIPFKIADFSINSIFSLSKDLVISGDQITLNGTGFGATQNGATVKIASVDAQILSWTNEKIEIKIPPTARPGNLYVQLSENSSNAIFLRVMGITSISHQRRPAGAKLTIYGHGFGTDTGYVLFNGVAAATVTAWNDNEIEVTIPDSATGVVAIQVSSLGTRTSSVSFNVTSLDNTDQSEGWTGREVVISGNGLGTGTGTDKITFNGIVASIISWQDNEIRARVPKNCTTGALVLHIGDWPITLVDEFVIYQTYEYLQVLPEWSGPRANSRPLLPGLAQDSQNNLYITDFDNGWVWKIAEDGSQVKFGNFNKPWGIAISPVTGYLYIADSGNSCLRVYDVQGNLIKTIGSAGAGNGQFSSPRGLAFSSSGYLFVADSGNNRIQVFSSDENFLTSFGSYGSGNGQLAAPGGVAADKDLIIYVADSNNHRIQRFIPNSVSSPSTWTFSGWLGSKDPNVATPGWLTTGTGLASNREGGFYNPYGVGIADSGELLVADTNNNRIQVLAATTGVFSNHIGAAGTTSGQYNQPLAVIFNNGKASIADSSNARIQQSSLSGTYIAQLVPDVSALVTDPKRIAVDSNNRRVYVLDSADGSISVFDLDGKIIQIIGSSGSGREQFYQPQGICVDSAGQVYVADTGNARVQKLSSEGKFIENWGIYGNGPGQFQQPNAIAVSADGQHLFITDSGLNRVQKFSSGGSFLAGWGASGADDNGFNFPSGIAIDAENKVYVADRNNHRIKKYSSDGTFIGWFGSYDAGAQAFWLDPGSNRTGAVSDADGAFDSPTDVAVDSEGNLFVADSGNFRIQKFFKNQADSGDAGFQTEVYIGDNLPALALDSWGLIHCLNSAQKVLRYAPDP